MKDVFRSPQGVSRRAAPGVRRVRIGLRAPLALAFALLFALAPLAGVARAQGPAKPNAPQYPLAEDSPTYIIYQTPAGETGCRAATPAEIEDMRRGNDTGTGLRQINHLGGKGALGTDAVSAGLTIILRGTTQLEANPAAKAAFIAAAAKWEAIISSPITFIIDVDYGPEFFGTPYSSANTLGATSSSGYRVNYPSVRQRLIERAPAGSEEAALLGSLPATALPTDIGSVPEVFLMPSMMRALGYLGPTPDHDGANPAPAPRIGFNSNFAFDFDPSNGVTFNQTDFDSVAVHEIGHALGFNSQVGGRELEPTRPLMATVWDFYRFRPGAGTPASFSAAPRVLSSGTSLTDPHVYFGGGAELQLSTGKPDGNGGDGEQASHWKDDVQGIPHIGIMDPTIRRGVHHEITANDLKAIDFFGYSVGEVIAPPAPANDNFAAAQTLAGAAAGRVTGTNAGATKEAGEPSHSPDNNPGGKSVWFNWTAAGSGPVTFTTGPGSLGGGSSYDTLLAAYTGGAVNSLSLVNRNDDSGGTGVVTSTIQFNALAGTTYRIAVDGYNADAGAIALSWNQTVTAPSVRFDSPSFSASENAGSAVIRVSRYIGGSGAFTVNYATSDGTATAGSGDYTPASGTLSFAVGESTKTFNVLINNDSSDEPNETVNITLGSPGGGAQIVAPAAVTLSIFDDDESFPVLSVSDPVVIEGNAGTSNAVFTASLSAAGALPVSVNYATANGTAAAGSDYAAASGALTFAPGETSKTVAVAVNGDTAIEGNENFFLNFSGPANVILADAQGSATVIDDDGFISQNPTIAFSNPSYVFSETGTSGVLVLTRVNGLASTVTVDVRTVDNAAAVGCGDTTTLPGVAFARCDYATTVDTVTFGPGEQIKTVTVPLIDDAHGERDETVQLALSNPTGGAQLGPQLTASLVILSNEPAGQSGATNPVNGNAFFVRQQYLDFLSREPDAGGFDAWLGVLNNCPNVFNTDPNSPSAGCDRLLVSSSFFRSTEFELKGRYAFRFYKATFGRLPEYSEIVVDMRSLTGATGPEVIARRAAFPAQWVQRADFKAAFDSKTNEEFVNTLMGRYGLLLITTFHPSTPESGAKIQLSRTGMASAINNGQWTRAQVLRAIADSDEVGGAEFNSSFVAMQYYGYLRRTPEQTGYEAWLNYLNANPNDSRTMVNGFANSVEYRLRFGPQ